MWDLRTIIKINEIASELAKEGKSPSAAIHELSKRRSKAAAEQQKSVNQNDSEKKVFKKE